MANHKSSAKRAKQDLVKKANNKAKSSKVRSAVKVLRKAITEKNKDEAKKMLVEVQSMLAKLAKSSAMKKNTASRKTSRLAAQISKI